MNPAVQVCPSMCSSHGTALSLLVHLLLLSCQVRSPRGEQLRGVGRRGTEECESLVGCGEAAQRASIPESSQGSLWIEGLVPYVFQANLGECKTPDSGVVVYADPVPGRGVVWCCSTPVVCSRNHSIYHRALVCVCVALTGDDVRASFSKAMVMWERETCIRFVPRTTEEDYVELGEGG